METPLAACLDLPGNGARNLLDACGWHVRWEPQEEGVMRTAASFPQYETKVIEPVGAKKHVEGWWRRDVVRRNTRDSGANVEPAQHNQSTLPQRNSEVVNLTGLL